MSFRIHLTLPDSTGHKLRRWAKFEGRAPANLAGHLIELAIAAAEQEGKIPPDEEGDIVQFCDRHGLDPGQIAQMIADAKSDHILC